MSFQSVIIVDCRTDPFTDRVHAYLETCLKSLPCALRIEEARKRLADREAHFAKEIVRSVVDEPISAKRRIR